jgi:predicted nucleic acid-binding protein
MKPIDVVSNTSPLIFLEKIDSLNLLKNCFRSIYIPEGVKNEWGVKSIPSFISVHPISEFGKSFVKDSIGRLHKGELEAIQLTIELNCKVILLDDLLARRVAERKNLVPLGVLGVLKIAYKLELLTLDEVKLKVSELINNHGLFITSNILKQYIESF